MKYAVYGEASVSVYIEVEAESPEDAIDMAYHEFEGLSGFAGNGGRGKLVGVTARNVNIEPNEGVEFFSAEEKE